MTDPMMQQITKRVADEIRNSATDNDARATALRDEATQHRAKAAELRIEADGLEQRAKDAEANAVTWGLAAQVKRQQAAEMLGRPELPTPGMITPVGDLGMAVGALRMVPRPDASAEELASFRDLMQAVHAQALHQQQLAAGRLRDAQATIKTGQLAPEDIPQPDPLSGSPAEESGAHPVATLPAGPPPDFAGFEPPRVAVVGTSGTGAGAARIAVEPPEPDADATCEYCLTALVRVGGTWLHAQTMASECGPGSEHLTATPVDVTYRGGDDADVPEPDHEPPADPKPDTARRGMRRIARTGRTGRTGRRPKPERSDDPSALALDGEITQAFPAPVAEDGGESRA